MKYNLKPTAKSTGKKLAIQCLNEALFCVSSSVLIESIVIPNQPEGKI
jgi:hypothetical protein